MNWFRFKVELSAWLAKTALCVITTLLIGSVFFHAEGTKYYPLSMRLVADNEWIFPVGFVLAVAYLWFGYWKVFRIYRGRRAYGER